MSFIKGMKVLRFTNIGQHTSEPKANIGIVEQYIALFEISFDKIYTKYRRFER